MNVRLVLLLAITVLLTCCVQNPVSHNQNFTHPNHERNYTNFHVNSTSSPQFKFSKKYRARVVKVVDGDTIDVEIGGKVYRIRLLGVDCPETSASRNKPYEYDDITDLNYLAKWGARAKEFARSELYNRTVYVEFDKMAGFRGEFGRYLAYVYVNGTDFNALLLKKGLARVYVDHFSKEQEYIKLENYAREHGIGLWNYSTSTGTAITQSTRTTRVKITYIHYNAPGNDWKNPNGEYVVIRNCGNTTVNMNGWTLEDKAGHTFTFPNITLHPNETVTVHSGEGVDRDHVLYWGDGAIWNNNGDTAYLYDSRGRLVDTYTY